MGEYSGASVQRDYDASGDESLRFAKSLMVHQEKQKRTDRNHAAEELNRKIKAMKAIETNWGHPITDCIPQRLHPRQRQGGRKARIDQTEIPILEPERWSRDLLLALATLSGHVTFDQGRELIEKTVNDRHSGNSVESGNMQKVMELMIQDVKSVLAGVQGTTLAQPTTPRRPQITKTRDKAMVMETTHTTATSPADYPQTPTFDVAARVDDVSARRAIIRGMQPDMNLKILEELSEELGRAEADEKAAKSEAGAWRMTLANLEHELEVAKDRYEATRLKAEEATVRRRSLAAAYKTGVATVLDQTKANKRSIEDIS